MSKAKLIAISAMCSVVAFGCLMLAALPGLSWAVLILGVIASVATVIPILIDCRNLVYTLLVYVASSILGVFLGLANIVYVAPIVAFCVPFAIVKAYGESTKSGVKAANSSSVTPPQQQETQVFEDPFDDEKTLSTSVATAADNTNNQTTVSTPQPTTQQTQQSEKPRLNRVVRWALYYVVLEVALALTVGAAYLFTRPVFDAAVSSGVLWWVLGGMQIFVIPYNVLVSGCLFATRKLLQKVIKP